MKKNFSLYGLPENVEYCKNCVISNQRPNSVVEFKNANNQKKGIKFNNGVCEACNYSKIKDKINWLDREKELLKLLEKSQVMTALFQVVEEKTVLIQLIF